jgi:hypothetical protein
MFTVTQNWMLPATTWFTLFLTLNATCSLSCKSECHHSCKSECYQTSCEMTFDCTKWAVNLGVIKLWNCECCLKNVNAVELKNLHFAVYIEKLVLAFRSYAISTFRFLHYTHRHSLLPCWFLVSLISYKPEWFCKPVAAIIQIYCLVLYVVHNNWKSVHFISISLPCKRSENFQLLAILGSQSCSTLCWLCFVQKLQMGNWFFVTCSLLCSATLVLSLLNRLHFSKCEQIHQAPEGQHFMATILLPLNCHAAEWTGQFWFH